MKELHDIFLVSFWMSKMHGLNKRLFNLCTPQSRSPSHPICRHEDFTRLPGGREERLRNSPETSVLIEMVQKTVSIVCENK